MCNRQNKLPHCCSVIVQTIRTHGFFTSCTVFRGCARAVAWVVLPVAMLDVHSAARLVYASPYVRAPCAADPVASRSDDDSPAVRHPLVAVRTRTSMDVHWGVEVSVHVVESVVRRVRPALPVVRSRAAAFPCFAVEKSGEHCQTVSLHRAPSTSATRDSPPVPTLSCLFVKTWASSRAREILT